MKQVGTMIARKTPIQKCLPCILLLALSWEQMALGQAAASSPTQLQTVQQQAWSALMGAVQPTALVLDGTFTSTEGSLQQSGNAHLTVGSDGSFSVSLSRSVGPTGESRTVANGIPTCLWTDQENVAHNSSFLNCMPPAWFFPGLALLSNSSDASVAAWVPSSYAVDSLGDHLRFQFIRPYLNGSQQDLRFLSPLDLVLAPDTHLPQYALFSAHSDSPGVNMDIPVQIAYSNYQNVSGVMIPFHIQRFVNGSLVLDLVITTASVQ